MIFVHRIASFRQFSGALSKLDSLEKMPLSSACRGMTAIFDQAFDAAFSAIYAVRLTDNPISFLGMSGRVETARLYVSSAAKLDGMEGDDYLLYFALCLEGTPEEYHARMQQHLGDVRNPRDRAIPMLAILSELGCAQLADALVSAFPGASGWIRAADPEHRSTLADIYAFYHYAWLLLLRVERVQLSAPLREEMDALSLATKSIVQQRIRLLNIERFFLTTDRSNVDEYKAACTALKNKFSLDVRFARLSAIHAHFEAHLENTSSVLQARQTQSFNFMIRLLAATAIPLSIFSTLMTVALNSDIVARPDEVVGNHRIYLVAALSIAVPAALLTMALAADRMKRAVARALIWFRRIGQPHE